MYDYMHVFFVSLLIHDLLLYLYTYTHMYHHFQPIYCILSYLFLTYKLFLSYLFYLPIKSKNDEY